MSPIGPILLFFLLSTSLIAEEKRTANEARHLVIDWLSNSRDFKSLELDFIQERQLKTLRQPLSRQGKLYITQSGQLRWQIDTPPTHLLLRNRPDAPHLRLDLKKHPRETLTP
jgi:hypothetical protein